MIIHELYVPLSHIIIWRGGVMKRSIRIGLLMLFVLSIFSFCATCEIGFATETPKNTSEGLHSSASDTAIPQVRCSRPVWPRGPGSGGGQGPGGKP